MPQLSTSILPRLECRLLSLTCVYLCLQTRKEGLQCIEGLALRYIAYSDSREFVPPPQRLFVERRECWVISLQLIFSFFQTHFTSPSNLSNPMRPVFLFPTIHSVCKSCLLEEITFGRALARPSHPLSFIERKTCSTFAFKNVFLYCQVLHFSFFQNKILKGKSFVLVPAQPFYFFYPQIVNYHFDSSYKNGGRKNDSWEAGLW